MNKTVDIKNLGEISIEDLREKLVASGVEWAQELAPKSTRIETRRAWEVEGREATDEEVDLLVDLPFVLGSSVTPTEGRELTQDEVDDVVYELTSVNKAKDMLEGRVSRIRKTVFESLTFLANEEKLSDPEFQPGVLISEKHGIKLSREISGGKPYVDLELSREVLGDRFDSIVNRIESIRITYGPDGSSLTEETNVEYEINEVALETMVTLEKISFDELQKITKLTKRTARFSPRKI